MLSRDAARPIREKSAGRIDALDGVRALAITMVVAYHWGSAGSAFTGGYIGVDLFFVLSGYLITRVLWKSPTEPDGRGYVIFLLRRIRRLYPALIGLVAGVSIMAALWATPASLRRAADSALLVLGQAAPFTSGPDKAAALFPFSQTWSLAIEWCFYLVWPLVLLFLRTVDFRSSRILPVGALGLAVLSYLLSTWLVEGDFYFSVTSRSAQLLAGSALALTTLLHPPSPTPRQRSWRPWAVTASIAFVVLWSIGGPANGSAAYEFIGFPLTTLASVVLVAACAIYTGDRASRLLAWRPLLIIGRASYSLYLWHLVPFLVLLRMGLATVPGAVLCLALTALLTAVSYRYLEAPFLGGKQTYPKKLSIPVDALVAMRRLRWGVRRGGR